MTKFLNKYATVSGPTPPGTGVISAADFSALFILTSPTILPFAHRRPGVNHYRAFFHFFYQICFADAGYDDISFFGQAGKIFCVFVGDCDISKTFFCKVTMHRLADGSPVADQQYIHFF